MKCSRHTRSRRGLPCPIPSTATSAHGFAEDAESYIAPEVFTSKETIDLIRAYYNMQEGPRKRLLDLAKTIAGAEANAA